MFDTLLRSDIPLTSGIRVSTRLIVPGTNFIHRQLQSKLWYHLGMQPRTDWNVKLPNSPISNLAFSAMALYCLPSACKSKTACLTHIPASPTNTGNIRRSHTTLLLGTEWVSGEHEDIGSRGALR
jgi:hypothetical protein